MNQDVAVSRLLSSISTQLGGLSVRQTKIIGNSLYYAFGVGYDAANRIQRTTKKVLRIDGRGNKRYFNSITEAARATSTDRCAINRVLQGKYKQWKGSGETVNLKNRKVLEKQ